MVDRFGAASGALAEKARKEDPKKVAEALKDSTFRLASVSFFNLEKAEAMAGIDDVSKTTDEAVKAAVEATMEKSAA